MNEPFRLADHSQNRRYLDLSPKRHRLGKYLEECAILIPLYSLGHDRFPKRISTRVSARTLREIFKYLVLIAAVRRDAIVNGFLFTQITPRRSQGLANERNAFINCVLQGCQGRLYFLEPA
jgi:hypothetical protein